MNGSQQSVDTKALLGVRTPLPALYEDVLRAWRGLPVRSRRLQTAEGVLARWPGGLDALADTVLAARELTDDSLLAATLWARARPDDRIQLPPGFPETLDDPQWTIRAMACLTQPDADGRFTGILLHLLEHHPLPSGPPPALPLLCFLQALHAQTLSPNLFARCVRNLQALHPAIAAGRPFRAVHRLLDYLGLSQDSTLQFTYRQLAAEIWPHATAANWSLWQWVTTPGGPDLFPQTVDALMAGECTVIRLHEARYAPLPPARALADLLADLPLPVVVLLCWVRPALIPACTAWPWLADGLRWLTASNQSAAATAYAAPSWWDAWLYEGLPAAREALGWLRELEIPPPPSDDLGGWRHEWLERALVPHYRACCANLLLAQAGVGEEVAAIFRLARDGDLPALRALAMLPTPDDDITAWLFRILHTGGRTERTAARDALAHLAQQQGLPGVEELERQRLLSAAWEPGPLAGERVRVGWPDGVYRFRLSLRDGRVSLETLGPRGPMHQFPAALRQTEGYRQARAAQRETQEQYRLFRRHLERRMLESTPFAGREFTYLLANPIFAHLTERLLWRTADGREALWSGPGCWETLRGEQLALATTGDIPLTLTLAHPAQLAREGSLPDWQLVAADRRLVQPFKQLFREVYLPDPADGAYCERFAGRRVDPRRAYALLRAAGFAPGSGVARHDWPGGVTAHLCWADAAEGHDLFGPQQKHDVATGVIWFTRAGVALPVADVAPVIFSETLRAADLLTTRAAVGEADLTSRETLALRAVLLRQVTRSFSLTNIVVKEDGQYALVLGNRATYRVNLASGTVYLEPEGRQVLVPHHDARWRPVEDGDLTSEILGLTLALAHDEEIADLTFLAQLGPGNLPVR